MRPPKISSCEPLTKPIDNLCDLNKAILNTSKTPMAIKKTILTIMTINKTTMAINKTTMNTRTLRMKFS